MNRRQRIIVSLTGIFLVLLILIGLTYGYFLTRIDGNINDKSISVKTKYLKLIYDDGTPMIEGAVLEPITSDNIKTKALKKTFSIAKAAASDDIYAKLEMADIVITDNFKDYDFKWALYQGETKITTGTFVQAMDRDRIVLANNILVNSTTPKEYDLYIWIDETGIDQSNLMGGSLTARIEPSGTGEELRTLASVILGENNSNVTTTTPTFSLNSTDRGLFVQQAESETDEKSEYGFPTYYYRGSATHNTINPDYKMNNYVRFGTYQTNSVLSSSKGEHIIWRIVRINEDGTIKLISEDTVISNIEWDLEEPFTSKYKDSKIMPVVEDWYNSNIASNPSLHNKVVTSSFCNDTSDDNIGFIKRLRNPIFTCPKGAVDVVNSKIGMITADEATYAGLLFVDIIDQENHSYLVDEYHDFWTLTPRNTNSLMIFDHRYKYLDSRSVRNQGQQVRVVINVSSDVIVTSGDGLSAETAYIIDVENINEPKTINISNDTDYQSRYKDSFSQLISTSSLGDGSTIKLSDGTYDLSLLTSYYIPKNLTIVGSENTIVKNLFINTKDANDTTHLIYNSNVIEGLTLSNIKFTETGIHSAGYLKNLTVKDCTFENGASIRLGMNTYSATLTNENTVVKNNEFSGTYSSYSHVHITNPKGTTTVNGNTIEGGYAAVQLGGNVSGTANITNNTMSNTSNAAFRIAKVMENTNINVTGNTISNAIKTSTGAIARIGDSSDLPASATIKFTNNTYDGATWPNSTWSNIQGEFGINAAGEKVES